MIRTTVGQRLAPGAAGSPRPLGARLGARTPARKWLLLGLTGALGACSGGQGPTGPGPSDPPDPPPGSAPAALEATTPTLLEAEVDATVQVGIRVRAADGTPVGGVAVQLSVLGGGGQAPGTVSTSSAGLATAEWRLGRIVGDNTLRATVSGLSPLAFTARTRPGPASSLGVLLGDGQTATAGTTLPYVTLVSVEDAFGNRVPGVAAEFEVGGGGRTFPLIATSSSGGLVAANWRLGPQPGESVLRVTAEGVDAPLELRATGRAPSTPFELEVTVEDPGDLPGPAMEALAAAALKVRSVFSDAPEPIRVDSEGFECAGVPVPPIHREIASPLIHVAVRRLGEDPGFEGFAGLDGVGTVCGFRFIQGRDDFRISLVGVIVLDESALEELDEIGALEPIITHELFHAMGIGSIWGADPSLGWTDLVQGRGGTDPRFRGGAAIAAYGGLPGNAEGGLPVPLENEGPEASRDSHWRRSVFNPAGEMMLAAQELGFWPVSVLSIRALEDLGYAVAPDWAEPYEIGRVPTTVPLLAPSSAEPAPARALLEALRHERDLPAARCGFDLVAPHEALAVEVETGTHIWRSLR